MLCILKSSWNLLLWTVVDCQKWNANTVQDITLLPDQDQIRQDIARATYRSKIDLSDTYEQVHMEPEEV